MRELSVGQRKNLAEFFTNSAVAWLTAGIIAPFFVSKKFTDFASLGIWGLLFSLLFLGVSLAFTKGVRS